MELLSNFVLMIDTFKNIEWDEAKSWMCTETTYKNSLREHFILGFSYWYFTLGRCLLSLVLHAYQYSSISGLSACFKCSNFHLLPNSTSRKSISPLWNLWLFLEFTFCWRGSWPFLLVKSILCFYNTNHLRRVTISKCLHTYPTNLKQDCIWWKGTYISRNGIVMHPGACRME